MRIAIIGPTHPYKGGIALHTTELAHRLQAAGHEVQLVSWKHQYPKLLYPGEQRLAATSEPEIEPFAHTSEVLNWYNPLGWWRAGRRLRHYDVVIMTYVTPQFQGTAGLVMLRALRGLKRPGQGKTPRVVALCHNVVQHDPRPGEALINKLFLGRVDIVLTHTDRQATLAREFTRRPVRVAALATHLPGAARRAAAAHSRSGAAQAKLPPKHQLLFFGLVRKYKGVDVLLAALARVPGVRLVIAGEAWASMQTAIEQQIAELGLADRVDFRPGYVLAEQLERLFAGADALVLPYRSGSGTQTVAFGFAFGLPVITTTTALHPGQVEPEINAIICQPDDVDSLAQAIKHLYEQGVLARLRANVTPPSDDQTWQTYLDTLLAPQ